MTPINSVEWSIRAQNCLAHAGIESMEQLANSDIRSLQAGRNAGTVTVREYLRGCLSCLIKPAWLQQISKVDVRPLETPSDGMVLLAGPYSKSERVMLECALAQLWPIPAEVTSDAAGYWIWRSTNGFKAVEAE